MVWTLDGRLSVTDPYSDCRYNWKPENTRLLRAGIAKASAGGQAFFAAIGDSGTEGFGATDMEHSWPMLLPSRWGVRRAGSGMRLAYANGIFDPWTFPGGWSNGASASYVVSATVSPAVFAPSEEGDAVVIWYFNNSAVTADVVVDGVTVGTITPVGGVSIGAFYFAGLPYGNHTVEVVPASTGAFYLIAGSILDETNGGASIANIAVSGSTAQGWSDTTFFYDVGSAFPTLASPRSATFIHLGLNDANTGRTDAQFKTDLSTVIDLWNGEGDVIIVAATDAHTAIDPSEWAPYLTAMYELADQFDIPLVDLTLALGTQAEADANGLVYSDDVHYNNAGNAAYADAISGETGASVAEEGDDSAGVDVYVHDGTDYQGPLLRAFFGPVDPTAEGFTGTDGDGWIDFGALVGILDEAYDTTAWNGDTTHAASRNVLRDKFVDIDAYLSFVRQVRSTLTDKTTFAGTSYEQWGSETALLDDALLPKLTGVTVTAQVFGVVLNDVGGTSIGIRVEISLDGGATWDSTNRTTQVIMGAGTNANNRYSVTAGGLTTGTVTGDILARAVASCSSGAATNWDLVNGHIIMTVEVHP